MEKSMTDTNAEITKEKKERLFAGFGKAADNSGKFRLSVLLLLFLAAVLLEVSVFQYSFWRGIFWKAENVTERVSTEGAERLENGSLYSEDGVLTFTVEDVGTLHSLSLTGQLYPAEDTGGMKNVTYEILVTDEGNKYPYQLTEKTIPVGLDSYSPGKTNFASSEEAQPNTAEEGFPVMIKTRLYPYGQAGQMQVTLRGDGAFSFALGDMSMNSRMPFYGSLPRVMFFTLFFCFLYGIREKSGWHKVTVSQAMSAAACRSSLLFFFLIMTGFSFAAVNANPACQGIMAPHHAQYQELAVSLANGDTAVDRNPAEGLVQAGNPYDTVSLLAEGVPYRADYVYYDGAYYVYFGIIPELLLYFPFYLLTGSSWPNHLAVFVFFAGFIAAVMGLLWELARKYFESVPFFLYLTGCFIVLTVYPFGYLLFRPDLYTVPIVAANCFVAAGLWLWLRGMRRMKQAEEQEESKGRRRAKSCLFLGSLAMALAVGCRPQFFLYSFLALPLFWEWLTKEKRLFRKKGISETVCLLLPYVLVGAGLMYYNFIRFDSIFDFGANYSLTNNDMTHRGINLERILYGIFYFLFQPPHLEGSFPFVQGADFITAYPGKMVSETFYGGILICNPILWLTFLFPMFRKKARAKKILVLETLLLVIPLITAAVDANGAGVLQRYGADMILGFALAGVLLLWEAVLWAREKGIYAKSLKLLTAALVWNLFFAGMTVMAGSGVYSLREAAPKLFYEIAAMFRI